MEFQFRGLFYLASTAWAQIDVGDFTITVRGRSAGCPEASAAIKQDLNNIGIYPRALLSPQLQLIIGGKKEDFYLNFDGGKIGREDQNYSLRFGRYGLLDVQFEYEQIPHLFDVDTARTPYNVNGSGQFSLPAGRRSHTPETTAEILVSDRLLILIMFVTGCLAPSMARISHF